MNKNLESVLSLVEESKHLTDEEKKSITKSIINADKELEITAFKLELTEKVKRTTAILLEETIEELEQKRKAVEKQKRDLEIEASLERIRSHSMALQKSADLEEVIKVVFAEWKKLGLDLFESNINIVDHDNKAMTIWSYGLGYTDLIKGTRFQFFDHPFLIQYIKDFRNLTQYSNFEMSGENNKDYLRKAFTITDFKYAPEEYKQAAFAIDKVFISNAFMKFGSMDVISFEPLPDDKAEILIRFAKVFEQTYTRFLDLQKAEEQAREAKIQLALERVRARTMAMQKSEELAEVSYLLNKQVVELGIPTWGCAFNIYNENDSTEWFSNLEGTIPAYHTPRENIFLKYYEAGQRGESLLIEEFAGERIKELYKYFASLNDSENETITNHVAKAPDYQINHMAYFKYGYLLFVTFVPAHEAHDIFKRFAKEFEQTYTRFLDLQKAEAQAREAEIQLSLERIRAKAMAMQHSDELSDFLTVLFEQFDVLNLNPIYSHLTFFDIDNNRSTYRMTGKKGSTLIATQEIDLDASPVWKQQIEEWKAGHPNDVDVIYIPFESLPEITEIFKEILEKLLEDERPLPEDFPNGQYVIQGYCKYGYLGYSAIQPPSDEEKEITRRIATEFGNVYQRFLDLQKAEAQAKEALIEAALERVRARTMAMQRSEELPEVAALLFQQVKALGVPQFHCGFNIFEIDDKECTWYPGSADGDILPPCKIPLTEHPIFMNFIESRKRGDELFVYEKEGEYQAGHYKYMLSLPVLGEILQNMLDAGIPFPTFQIDHIANFSHGNLLFITSEHFPEMHDTFKRFAKVFEQTYTRFLDLQKAEIATLEAIKRASVDRVRAEIASMRTTADLERITPIIWSELTTLGVPFIRCGVFIMDEEQQQVQSFLSTPDGNALAAFTQPYNASGETAQIVISWHKREIYKQHWDEAQFAEFTNSLLQQGAVKSGEKYLIENRPTDLYLHFLPFMQGMLYVGNTELLSDDALQLVQNLGNAFSTAYARYEDFNQLEAAKGQIEKTLVDLKQAQTQLIQSEKMASLGELTAGIAHEIQNPLNFVNNFSEVSTEMIDEMNEELAKGDLEEAKAISEDLKQNLIKINHHGNRASSIVKGMLEHSRTSSKEKQLTDINLLADEYLRLSYHGLRAKDKSFNADFLLIKDDNLPKIEVIPQDFGRVLLNLINNAFQAPLTPSGRAKQVIVRTKFIAEANSPLNRRGGGEVHISIKDNGSGIPKANLEKIFQPFFTTKPTGQGTGLGLSLAYDIVNKGHGGTIECESVEDVGTEFIVKLPIV